MNTTYQLNGYRLHLIPSKKFKDITISVRMKGNLSKDTAALRSVLGFAMIDSTKRHPTQRDMAGYLEELYGAGLSANIFSKGEAQIIAFKSTCINEEFLPVKEKLILKQIDLLKEVFFEPLVDDHAFDKHIIEIKKKEIHDRIQANKDDKVSYSLDKLFEYMGRGTALALSASGTLEEVDSIDERKIYDAYCDMIAYDDKDVYVVGDVDESIVEIFDQNLSFSKKMGEPYASVFTFHSERDEVLEVIEKQEVVQSKLNLGYTINCDLLSPENEAFNVFAMILGGNSQSRLFKVVREKNSLCYYISASYDAMNGIMIINAGIEMTDYEKAKNLIAQQIVELQEGYFEQDEIDLMKSMIISSLRKSSDDPDYMISLAYNRDIVDKKQSVDDYIEAIEKVTKDEIVACAKQVKLDSVYFLTGKEFHE